MSLSIDVVSSAGDVRDFLALPHRLYGDTPQWVPEFRADLRRVIRRKHPIFAHAMAEFFLVKRGLTPVVRGAVVINDAYNRAHGLQCASFYYFDAKKDSAAVRLFFATVQDWARARGMNELRGPMMFGGTSGSGILVDGFDRQAAMTMMRYNHPYYGPLLEDVGFEPLVDLYSAEFSQGSLRLPTRVSRIAEIAAKRGRISVQSFKNKRELKAAVPGIKALYNQTLADHIEDYPLSHEELDAVAKELLTVADPRLIKLLREGEKIIGFLFAFPDLSPALRKNRGRLGPIAAARLMLSFRRARRVLFNGMGILPRYQRRGGNALLYAELAETVKSRGFTDAEIVQVAGETTMMLRDLKNLGASIHKTHRIYKMPYSV